MDHPRPIVDSDEDFLPMIGGASGLIVQDGKVLLIRRGSQPFEGYWSLPSGGVERGERLRETVKREVFEETGLVVEVGVIAGYREYLSPEGHYVMPAFFCLITGGQLRAGDDAAAAEFVDLREVHALCVVPGLEDVFQDAGILERR